MSSETSRRRPRRDNDLLATVEELAVGVGRLGYGILSFGLDLLPKQSRGHMHNAIHELSHAFATLPGDFATIAGAEIEKWAAAAEAADDASVGAVATEARVQRVKVGSPDGVDVTIAQEVKTTVVTSPAGVGIAYIEFDPPGRDRDGEYVLIRNDGQNPAELTGWVLRDGGARHSYTFPAFTLPPGAELKLWTKAGTDDGANLYWGEKSAIWNNTGDSATLSDAAGNLIGRYAYEGAR